MDFFSTPCQLSYGTQNYRQSPTSHYFILFLLLLFFFFCQAGDMCAMFALIYTCTSILAHSNETLQSSFRQKKNGFYTLGITGHLKSTNFNTLSSVLMAINAILWLINVSMDYIFGRKNVHATNLYYAMWMVIPSFIAHYMCQHNKVIVVINHSVSVLCIARRVGL